MITHVGATEAARLLGVTKPTLYAYVSRGMLNRRTAVDGRTSLYERGEVEALASRSRRRGPVERPTIDVQITSAITELSDDGVRYRGLDVADLARSSTFEQVAELLWTGTLPSTPPAWKVERDALERCRAALPSGAHDRPLVGLALAGLTLSVDDPETIDGPTAGRRLMAIAPSLLGGPNSPGGIARRLSVAWRRRPPSELVDAVSCALVLLADHELATSTLAVRVACSVRADPYAALTSGLAAVGGSLHGGASSAAAALLVEAEQDGADRAVRRRLDHGERLPGFGHSVYRNGDPRLEPLLDAVRRIPGRRSRLAVVDGVLTAAGRSLGHLPNVDLGLGALFYVGDLPHSAPLFAVARIAGWSAHYDEELAERPVRYRGLARMPEVGRPAD